MRLPMFLAVVAAAFAASSPGQQYTDPTFAQVERLIGAVKEAGGDSSAYTAAVGRISAYPNPAFLHSRPTYSQMERLIAAVRTNGVSGSVSPGDVAAITGIHIGESTVKTQYVKGVWTVGATAESDKTVEIGVNAHATETSGSSQSIAIGRDSLANGSAVVAVGPNSFAEGDQAVAVGWRANAVGAHSVSIGSAKKSGESYYKDGAVNPASDLQLAEGPYSVAIGYNDKANGNSSIAIGNEAKATINNATAVGKNAQATAEGAVQIGTGVNASAHTLKFEDVVVVKNGQVVGSAPDPQEADPVRGATSDYDYMISVSPGSVTTLLPSGPLDGGSDMGVQCSGMRNYTVYLPNEPEVREGLPIGHGFNLPADVRYTALGPDWVSKLPCRIVVEQPYSRLVVFNTTEMDDGYDWTPVITNSCIAYHVDGRFVCTNSWSVLGTSLHCAMEFKLSYPLQSPSGATNTVDLITVPSGQAYLVGSLWGRAPAIAYTIQSGEEPDISSDVVKAVLKYKTVNGYTEFPVTLDLVTE